MTPKTQNEISDILLACQYFGLPHYAVKAVAPVNGRAMYEAGTLRFTVVDGKPHSVCRNCWGLTLLSSVYPDVLEYCATCRTAPPVGWTSR